MPKSKKKKREEKEQKEKEEAEKKEKEKEEAEKKENERLLKLKAEIKIITISVICILILFSLFSKDAGVLGGFISSFLTGMLGAGAYIAPVILIGVSAFIIIFKRKNVSTSQKIMIATIILLISSFINVVTMGENPTYANAKDFINKTYNLEGHDNGGLLGALISSLLLKLFGKTLTNIVLATSILILVIIVTGESFFAFIMKLGKGIVSLAEKSMAPYFEYDEEDLEADEEYEPESGDIVESPHEHTSGTLYYSDSTARDIYDFGYRNAGDAQVLERTEGDFLNSIVRMGLNNKIKATKPTHKISLINLKDAREVIESRYDSISTKMDSRYDDADDDEDGIDIKIVEKVPELDNMMKVSAEPENFKLLSKTAIDRNSAGNPDSDTNLEESGEPSETKSVAQYKFPDIELLRENTKTASLASRTQIYENSKKLEQTLKSFGVEARVVEVSKGPTVTRYEVSPGAGVKVSKISNLADDLALNLAAVGIRIEAPIPGKSVVGIEIPNKEIQTVYIREVLDDANFRNHPSKLACALGKDIAGNTVITDIARMPHLLIAGSTGSGKSVCINTLITSLIYKATPSEVKLLMIDPKVVELSIYNGIPHLLIPVVTDPKKAAGALNWAVTEMNNRYQAFAAAAVRDLRGYNIWKLEHGETDTLPQIVIIIDELADLMMAAPHDVEESICRLAQMARAAGLHLIIATQRPSVDVITGLIKANIPSRLAFAVSSGTDSRTILDTVGAEKLLGKGDMLFNPVGLSKPQRLQGAYISDKEVEAIVKFLKDQGQQEYDQKMVEKITSSVRPEETGDNSELLSDAVEFIYEKGSATANMLSKRFHIGYNHAAKIMNELENRGIVSPEDGRKSRKIILSYDELENFRINNFK